jgi:hypothetical protein
MQRRFQLVACIALFAAVGCAPLLDTPPQFLRLEVVQNDYDYRATTADGVVLAGRVLDYDEDRGGGLQFWTDAIKLRLKAVGGYALLQEQDIATHSGIKGKQLRFGHDENRGAYQYWITLFIDGDDLVVLETGGPEAGVKAHEADVMKALTGVRL